MTDQPVTYALTNGVATITLNRPDAMNSLDIATKEALKDAVLKAAEDQAVRCVVLTGTGRAFCVGQDLKEHIELIRSGSDDALFGTVPEHYNPIVTAVATMQKPVIAAVNGVAAGAGASLAFACDFRILSDTGSSWTLPRLVGRAKALELLYFPRTVPAAEAEELGMATKVVAAADLEREVSELAQKLATGPTVAFGAIRRSIGYSEGHDFASSIEFEGEMMTLTGATQDHQQAVASFVAKEKPTFEGR